MGVYFSWKPKCQQPAVLTRMLCATSASVLPTSIIFMYYFPSWHITTISSMPAKCFSNPNHAVTNFWRQVNDQVWKKHCLFLSSDKTARIKITLKQEHPWAYYRSEKEKSKYFLLLQHLTSWCITALYNPMHLSNASTGFANTVFSILRDGKAEKRREGVSAYRNYFSQQPWVNMLFRVLKWKGWRNAHQNYNFPQIR